MCFVCQHCARVSIHLYHLIKTYYHMRLSYCYLHRFKIFQSTWINQICMKQSTATTAAVAATRQSKQKVVVILGATGAGKSRLSIDLATRFFKNSEIINSDKMQIYSGLDITTNKITMQERSGVRHHLLGVIDPTKPVFTPSDFRNVGSEIISDVKSRCGLPLVVGGSNSLIYSLVAKQYDPELDVFNGGDTDTDPDPVSSELRYDCCFIWVDVSLPVLNRYLVNRVDEMLDTGMFEELEEFFRTGEDKRVNRYGLGQAIGLPEFERYFTEYLGFRRMDGGDSEVDVTELQAYNEAVKRIKDNTCQLAETQVSKILRLRDIGWELNRIDATEAFRAVMTADSGGGKVAEVWEKQVVEPSMKIVKQFLDETERIGATVGGGDGHHVESPASESPKGSGESPGSRQRRTTGKKEEERRRRRAEVAKEEMTGSRLRSRRRGWCWWR